MGRRPEAYVDTSALIAFLDRSDTHHPLFRGLFTNPPPLVTTALVVAEGHAWFLRRFDGGRAPQFLSFVGEQLLASKDKDQADYLKSYVRKTENLVQASTRAGESPVIYPVPKHVAGTAALVFAVFLMVAAFVAVAREPAGRDRR